MNDVVWTRGIANWLITTQVIHTTACLVGRGKIAEYRGRKLAIIQDANMIHGWVDNQLVRSLWPTLVAELADILVLDVDTTVDAMIDLAAEFKPGMTVRIISQDPTWQRATCAEPMPGMTAKVVAMNSFLRNYAGNEGRVCLEFDETMLGYEPSDDGPITVTYEPQRLEIV